LKNVILNAVGYVKRTRIEQTHRHKTSR